MKSIGPAEFDEIFRVSEFKAQSLINGNISDTKDWLRRTTKLQVLLFIKALSKYPAHLIIGAVPLINTRKIFPLSGDSMTLAVERTLHLIGGLK